MKMSEIIPGLYLGGIHDAFNVSLPKNTTVINMAAEVAMTPYAAKYIHIPTKDYNQENISQYFETTFNYIENELSKGNNVLVHCAAGVSRSATIVVAYLIKKYKWSYNKALDFVKAKRPCINPNLGFVMQLFTYGNKYE